MEDRQVPVGVSPGVGVVEEWGVGVVPVVEVEGAQMLRILQVQYLIKN